MDFEFGCNIGTFTCELIWLFLSISGAMHALLNAESDIRKILHYTGERLDQLGRTLSNKAAGMKGINRVFTFISNWNIGIIKYIKVLSQISLRKVM